MPVEGTTNVNNNKKKKLHLVVLTFPGKGHINPLMVLAKQLAKLGACVTFVFPSKAALSILTSGSADPTEGLDIDLVALPIAGDDGIDRSPPVVPVPGIRRSPTENPPEFPDLVEPMRVFLRRMIQDPARISPAAVIIDMLYPWIGPAIDELGIPRFVFYSAAASHLASGLHMNANISGKNLQEMKLEIEQQGGIVRVPGLPDLRLEEICKEHRDESQYFFLGESGAKDFLLGSHGILMNTCYALEGKVIDALRSIYPHSRFLPIGPLLPAKKSAILPSFCWSQCEIWLAEQKPRSVIYISFGSWLCPPEKQIGALALGLEASGHPFLWILPRTQEQALPDGFRDRIRGRGLVITEWAPQNLILSHPAVGGFLTHCGWNSVSECVALAGVPMLCWPFVGDQPQICRWLVDELCVGVDIREDSEGFADSSEIARAVKAVMEDPELLSRAQLLKNKLNEDLEKQQNQVEAFVSCLKKYCA